MKMPIAVGLGAVASLNVLFFYKPGTVQFLTAGTGISFMVGFTIVRNVIPYLGSGLGS